LQTKKNVLNEIAERLIKEQLLPKRIKDEKILSIDTAYNHTLKIVNNSSKKKKLKYKDGIKMNKGIS